LAYGCRINKVAWKRPAGYFVAWLNEGLTIELAEGATREDFRRAHMAMRVRTKPGEVLEFDNRAYWRGQAAINSDMDRLFEWEEAGHRGHGPAPDKFDEPRDIQ